MIPKHHAVWLQNFLQNWLFMSCPFTINSGDKNITCRSLSYGFKPPRSPGPAGRMFLTYTPFSNKPSETLNPKSSPSESLYKVTCGGNWHNDTVGKKSLFSFLQALARSPSYVYFTLQQSLVYLLLGTSSMYGSWPHFYDNDLFMMILMVSAWRGID